MSISLSHLSGLSLQPTSTTTIHSGHENQAGFSLIIVLLILVVVSILGVGGIQISMMAERATRNDRDLQVAWQSAEAALIDAELDILGQPPGAPNKRNEIFARSATDVAKFIAGCGKAGDGKSYGLCSPSQAPGIKPDWLTTDFTLTDATANTVAFGAFTGRTFQAGGAGLQPAAAPRYMIEIMDDPSSSRTKPPGSPKDYLYRVTSLGFGPSANTQAVVQMIYRN